MAWRAPSPDGALSVTLPGGGEWTGAPRDVFAELNRQDPRRWRDGESPAIGNFKATPLMTRTLLVYALTAGSSRGGPPTRFPNWWRWRYPTRGRGLGTGD